MSPSNCLSLLLISLVTLDFSFFMPRFFASLKTKGAYDLDHRINVERNSPEKLYWPEEYVKSAKNFAP